MSRRYSGMLGISEQVEVEPGIWEEGITEVLFLGKVDTRSETVEQGDNILPRYNVTTTVSGLARGIGQVENSNLRYLTYAGKRWVIVSEQAPHPSLVLSLREEYHGPIPEPADRITEHIQDSF